ncbi:DUF4238 domain-containing protein [Brevundimonas sp. UBA5936]|jgi:hypothetical protein|uniref:DUF4238 domain-containing protein n=1 Tax=Brevundimonas sp. UBA5936 TaxID=1946133 RepID=UPI0025BA8832|nr:DUF4238 domain-containing protein [Brevundimonas sp. UBA5936]
MKHHYVPKFLLGQWTDETGRLYRYSRRADGKLAVRQMYPKGSGYGIDLYALAGAPSEADRQALETGFMQKIDDRGALALQALLATSHRPEDDRLALDWMRFVSSMISRSPDAINTIAGYAPVAQAADLDALEPEYQRMREADWAPTLAEHVAAGETGMDREHAKILLPRLITATTVLGAMDRMHWGVVHAEDADWACLLTDAPVRFGQLRTQDGFILMPIGPNAAFLAARNPVLLRTLAGRIRSRDFVRKLNGDIVSAAREVVFARDRRQDRFIDNRFLSGA